jgi:branched-chain amino acid transport system permease protein
LDFGTLVNASISGILTGLVYGLSALGLSVIFGVIRIVNFAHGEIMVIGMFLALLLFRLVGIDPLVAVPIVAIVLFGFGYVLQSVVVSRVSQLHDHFQFLLLAAIAIMITSALLLIFGPDPQNADVSYALDSFEISGSVLGVPIPDVIIGKPRLYAAVGAIVVASLLLAFFRYTPTGKAIRACADNHLGARVAGLNVGRLYALTFGLGTAALGAAGCIMLLLYDVQPYLAPGFTLLAFVIVIIGGLGSLYGALLGGILIGLAEALAAILIDPSLKSAFSFALLILVLLFRPQGLLGRAVR